MKAILLTLLMISLSVQADTRFDVPEKYNVLPATYIEELKIKDVNENLKETRKIKLACLFIHAAVVSKRDYNQTYMVKADAPAVLLFRHNFSEFNNEKWEGKRAGAGVIFLSHIQRFLNDKVSCSGT